MAIRLNDLGLVFLFCGGRKDRFKALYWDGQGFWLLYKRFENGKLTWPNTEFDCSKLRSICFLKLTKALRLMFLISFLP
ncbi:IS66 family insertion sequence element accessory protein TnpB [Streptococcus hillyeri]|uniref:IS66 family insertion sequence element accessory protein TnpB n=1 Tax=Streptococcus hillyeri TaxID=2282420 RepID=UPI001FEACACD|nr:IS66 family insertion sequence element accessory protein TnpB [Streptococcus hillyeri]